jgi:ankyrin repeat protein
MSLMKSQYTILQSQLRKQLNINIDVMNEYQKSLPNPSITSYISASGMCFGLSAAIAHAAFTEEKIYQKNLMRKKLGALTQKQKDTLGPDLHEEFGLREHYSDKATLKLALEKTQNDWAKSKLKDFDKPHSTEWFDNLGDDLNKKFGISCQKHYTFEELEQTPNPDTTSKIYERIDAIVHSKPPIPTASEAEKKEFYKQNNLFIQEVFQLQASGTDSKWDPSKKVTNMQARLNDVAFSDNVCDKIRAVDTYFFTDEARLLVAAKQLQPGDVLSVETPRHQMLIYAIRNTHNPKETIIGFYDPNNEYPIEVPQKGLASIPREFFPFLYGVDGVESFVSCTHMVAGQHNKREAINVPNDRFDDKQKVECLTLLSQYANLYGVNKLLQSNKFDVDTKAQDGWNALHCAINSQNAEIVELLLNKGADVNKPLDIDGLTPLYRAINAQNVKIAELLLSRGADVNKPLGSWTPLYNAVYSQNVEMAALFLRYGADVNRTKDGKTPLYCAVNAQNVEMAKLLIEKGADITKQGPSGVTPLAIATRLGDKKMVKLLEEATLSQKVIQARSLGLGVELESVRKVVSVHVTDTSHDDTKAEEYKNLQKKIPLLRV